MRVYLSGSSIENNNYNQQSYDIEGFLVKPFKRDVLFNILR